MGLVPVYVEDGTEYTDTGIDFRCRIHRGRRGKNVEGIHLEENALIRKTALKLPVGEVVQLQYLQGEIFAGVVLENRKSEQTLLVHVLPKGYVLNICWWSFLADNNFIGTRSRSSTSGYWSLILSILSFQCLPRMPNHCLRS